MIMLSQSEEISLVAMAKEDNNAFSELYNYFFPRIYNYVHYRVDDFFAADDLVSQIFEKLFSGLKYYQSEKSAFSTWIFSIARNAITDYYRSKIRVDITSIETTVDLIDFAPNPNDVAILNETQQHIQKALSLLKQRDRDIVALKFWSGFSNREIAKLIEISESNVGVILFRAMRQLRKILESQGFNLYD